MDYLVYESPTDSKALFLSNQTVFTDEGEARFVASRSKDNTKVLYIELKNLRNQVYALNRGPMILFVMGWVVAWLLVIYNFFLS